MTLFADASSEPRGAEYALLGVPYDATSSYRSGSRFAPDCIRRASYNFESFSLEHRRVFRGLYDAGDLDPVFSPGEMGELVHDTVASLRTSGMVPITLGGEHSLTPHAVRAVRPDIVVILDAHMDFRDSYLGERESHACAARRVSEVVGIEHVVVVGVRSASEEEVKDAEAMGLRYHPSWEVRERGIGDILIPILRECRSVYLSVDMDAMDPGVAPGVGNPEPFGLSAMDVKTAINIVAKKAAGMDIVEVSPPYDNGNTCALAARLVQELLYSR